MFSLLALGSWTVQNYKDILLARSDIGFQKRMVYPGPWVEDSNSSKIIEPFEQEIEV